MVASLAASGRSSIYHLFLNKKRGKHMSKMLKPKSFLLLMFALVMAFTTACSSGSGSDKGAHDIFCVMFWPV